MIVMSPIPLLLPFFIKLFLPLSFSTSSPHSPSPSDIQLHHTHRCNTYANAKENLIFRPPLREVLQLLIVLVSSTPEM